MRARYRERQAEVLSSATCATTDSIANATRGVDYVFHAAALKQVPSCEFYPMEAVRPTCSAPRTCSKRRSQQRRRAGRLLSHRQGGLSDQRHGHVQGDDGKGDGRQVAAARRHGDTRHLRHALRQRHGLARLGDPAVRRADQRAAAAHRHRPEDDALHDVARRRRRPRAVRLRARRQWRHLRAEGARRDDRRRWRSACARSSTARPTRSRSSAPATARSSTRRCSPARRWRAPRTWAATTALPPDNRDLNYASTSSTRRASDRARGRLQLAQHPPAGRRGDGAAAAQLSIVQHVRPASGRDSPEDD